MMVMNNSGSSGECAGLLVERVMKTDRGTDTENEKR